MNGVGLEDNSRTCWFLGAFFSIFSFIFFVDKFRKISRMSLNLKEELAKLSQTAPRLKDSDDEFSDQDTKARILGASKDFEDELEVNIGDNKRLRAGIADLSEYGKRYKGKSVSRKELDDDEFDEDLAKELIASEEEDEEDDSEEDDQDDQEEDASEVEDEDEEDEEMDSEDEEDEDETEEEGSEEEAKPKSKGKKDEVDTGLKVVNINQKEEAAKGRAVKNQLSKWSLGKGLVYQLVNFGHLKLVF